MMVVPPPDNPDNDDEEQDDRSGLARGLARASQATTVAAEMALPGLGGYWLDERLGTGMVWLLVGVAVGFAVGFWHLLRLAQGSSGTRSRP